MFAPISWLDKKITWTGFAINWSWFIWQVIGSLFVAFFLAYWSGLFTSCALCHVGHERRKPQARPGLGRALLRGIGCNWLVCLAVWLAIRSDDMIGKILSSSVPDHGLRYDRL